MFFDCKIIRVICEIRVQLKKKQRKCILCSTKYSFFPSPKHCIRNAFFIKINKDLLICAQHLYHPLILCGKYSAFLEKNMYFCNN